MENDAAELEAIEETSFFERILDAAAAELGVETVLSTIDDRLQLVEKIGLVRDKCDDGYVCKTSTGDCLLPSDQAAMIDTTKSLKLICMRCALPQFAYRAVRSSVNTDGWQERRRSRNWKKG